MKAPLTMAEAVHLLDLSCKGQPLDGLFISRCYSCRIKMRPQKFSQKMAITL